VQIATSRGADDKQQRCRISFDKQRCRSHMQQAEVQNVFLTSARGAENIKRNRQKGTEESKERGKEAFSKPAMDNPQDSATE
jgi:hypothetical protein